MSTEDNKTLCRRDESGTAENLAPYSGGHEEPRREIISDEDYLDRRRLNKKLLIIICSAVALTLILLVIAGIGFCSASGTRGGADGGIFTSKPEKILGEYIEAVEKSDAQAIARLHHTKVTDGKGAELIESADRFYNCGGGEIIAEYTVTGEHDPGDYFGGTTSYFVEHYSRNLGVEISEMKVLTVEISVENAERFADYFTVDENGKICTGFVLYKSGGNWYIDTVTDIFG